MTQDFSWNKTIGMINGYQATKISQVGKDGKTIKSDIYIDFNQDGIYDVKIANKNGTTSVFSAYAKNGQSGWENASSEYDIYKELDFQPNTPKKANTTETVAKTEASPIQTQTTNKQDEKPQQTEHKVAKNETLGTIAKKYGCTIEELARLNDIKNINRLSIGQVLKIPATEKAEKQESEVKVVTTKGNQEDFCEALAFSESSGNYKAQKGQYLGKYQLGRSALMEIGYMDKNGKFTKASGVKNAQEFLNSPEVQEKAMALYSKKQWSYIEKVATKYEGKTINGIKLTRSGMIAAAHLVGPTALKAYLTSEGKKIKKDGNGTSLERYLKEFGGYDVSGFTGNSRIAKS